MFGRVSVRCTYTGREMGEADAALFCAGLFQLRPTHCGRPIVRVDDVRVLEERLLVAVVVLLHQLLLVPSEVV